MHLTLRRRAVIAIVVGFPIGWMYIDIGWRLLFALVIGLRGDAVVGCRDSGSGLSNLIGQFNGCDGYGYHYTYAVVELVIGTVMAAVLVYALARFVTWPIHTLTDSMEQLGPNNLGLRIRPAGPRQDETRRLGESIDQMLDRVSEGYEAQRRFASNASHELRTPLATQRALIEVSLTSALTAEQLELLSRQLLATNERNERLIEGLLALAETERGLVTSTALSLDRIVADVAATLGPAARSGGLELSADLAPVTVIGEQPLLERLVTNLVQNAIKYNWVGGTVDVVLTRAGVLSVTNTGPAVPAEAVDGLFEPFRRMTGERLDHGGGVGLGLTIARSITAAHAGAIRARANSGGGLTVEITLPTV